MESGFIASGEYYTKAGSTNAGWVKKLYQDVLGRPASPSEVAGWIAPLRACDELTHLVSGVSSGCIV